MKEIKGFKDKYAFLSNMFPASFSENGVTFSCTESYYMGHKSGIASDLVRFSGLNGFSAKKLGKTVVLQDDWGTEKLIVMKRALILKFSQNPHLLEKLLATEDAYLEETNFHKDFFWGVCNGKGENFLGKLLMEVREELA
jgi:ribA/ribD-fused uncharacterized protein